jgi:hypothetical protein
MREKTITEGDSEGVVELGSHFTKPSKKHVLSIIKYHEEKPARTIPVRL